MLLTAIPAYRRDIELAIKNLEVAIRLDPGGVNHHAILSIESSVEEEQFEKLKELAESHFKQAFVIQRAPLPETSAFPLPQNRAWQDTLRHVELTFGSRNPLPYAGVFWWEPDAVPLRSGWLDAIFKAHVKGKKIVTGFRRGDGNQAYVNGVAVWPVRPSDYLDKSGCMFVGSGAPFDVLAGRDLRQRGFTEINGLMLHYLKTMGTRSGPSFNDAQASKLLADNPEAVIYHGCTDGSLHAAILGESFTARPQNIVTTIDKPAPNTSAKQSLIVQLGRYGDIINILPIAKAISQRDGCPVAWFVSKEYAGIFEGVSYVEPIAWDGEYQNLGAALLDLPDSGSQGPWKEKLIVQTYAADTARPAPACSSFCADQWRLAGWLSHWNKLPLVFDRRNLEREKALFDPKKAGSKPTLLVNLTTAKSSPYPDGHAILEDIKRRWGHKVTIVDLAEVKAERIFDLLAFYDTAIGLVSIDTATAHLARASKIPLVALITDKPTLWHGLRPPENCRAAIRYSEAFIRREEIHDQIETWIEAKKGGKRKGPPRARLLHVYPDFVSSDPETQRRDKLAQSTWVQAYRKTPEWRSLPVHDHQLTRLFPDGGKRFLPYTKDIIDFAARHSEPHDIIVLTNTDTCFASTLGDTILEDLGVTFRKETGGYARRRDFKRLDFIKNDEAIREGFEYCGKDLFAFRVSWWDTVRAEFPDMLFGGEGWDAVFQVLADEHGFVTWENVIYHERHDSRWERPENRYSLPSQKHCLRLSYEFMIKHNVDPEKHGIKTILAA